MLTSWDNYALLRFSHDTDPVSRVSINCFHNKHYY